MSANLPPTPIRIMLTPVTDDGFDRYVASSPDFPNCEVGAFEAYEAVQELLWRIAGPQPLSGAVKAALRGAGHTAEVIAKWESQAPAHLRRNARGSVAFFADYADAGISAKAALEFFDYGFHADTAGRIQGAGLTAAQAIQYYDEAETHKWWRWDFEPLPWVLAHFPIERLALYAYDLETAAEAFLWDEWVARNQVADEDVKVLLKAKFKIDEMTAAVTSDGTAASADSLVASARTLLGLAANPWAPSPPAVGQ